MGFLVLGGDKYECVAESTQAMKPSVTMQGVSGGQGPGTCHSARFSLPQDTQWRFALALTTYCQHACVWLCTSFRPAGKSP